MNNKWLKLAMVSFVGILVSSLGLFVVQSINGVAGLNSSYQVHGAQGQAMVGSPTHSGNNHGQTIVPNPQMPGQYYPGMVYQIYLMRQQIHQLREQLNNMNNSGGMGGMSMPMM